MKQNKTIPVGESVSRDVFGSPAWLPSRHKWPTNDAEVRKIEELLDAPANTIGSRLWVRGDRKTCAQCDRATDGLDTVASDLKPQYRTCVFVHLDIGST